ncbi:MAG TPA: nickel pincer cofactor biosynthesis protein LarC [Vicinamibacterales bacterium]|nr:nickel pincer cofactor biosynthesis protein LarC [Vicinamibacterales bacterium]
MAKTLYFDCFSGASGDMILGALLDLGLPLDDLRGALGSLASELGGVSADRVLRAGVSATKFRVPTGQTSSHPEAHTHAHPHHDHPHGDGAHHHSLKEIAGLIGRSALSSAAKQRAIHLFERLAEAEAAIHAVPVERVHLHEVGAADSIVDIVGAVYGLEQLDAGRIVSSPLNVGGGTVTCQHGVFPVPAPATARLLQGVPVYAGEQQVELVTPTGALIVTGYAESFGPLPPMTISRIGYGAGDRDPKRYPNVLRMIEGEEERFTQASRVVEIVCEIDDMNPQLFGPLMDQLHHAGALDVFYAPVQMKKNRPGTLVTVLARPEDREKLSGILFSETTTIGVRYQEMLRECLEREQADVETPIGPVRFKIATRAGRVLNASPEFDDCARIAAEKGLPLKAVQAIAMKAWLDRRD